jgi:hypothetical protein
MTDAYDAKDGDSDDPMSEMRQRYKAAESACRDQYEQCKDDIRFAFIPGEQWDKAMKKQRGRGRSLYEFNKTRPAVKAVTNDMRQNSPSVKYRAAEDSHRELADILQGLFRNVEAQSRADTAYDTAGFYSAAGGFGVFEITTEYSDDDTFEQDIRIREKRNPFAFKFDPAAKEFDRRDGRYLFEDYSIPLTEYKRRYPNAKVVDFSQGLDIAKRYDDWFTEKEVRIAKYWCKHPAKKTIYQLSDERVLDEDDYKAIEAMLGQPRSDPATGQPLEPLTLKTQRVVAYDKIDVSIVSGAEVLEGPTEWVGKFFPVCPVWGDTVNIDGEEIYSGIVRPAKDSQRLFNWNVCTGQEVLGKQPIAPLMATPAMIEGHEAAWEGLATDNAPALLYNVDPAAPNGGAPTRAQPPTFPGAMFQGAQFAADLLKSVTGVVDGPVQSKASSGKAILAVEHQQDVTNFDYIDNLARAKAYAGEIFADLAPKIYTTEREMMILGADGKESYVQLNQTVQGPDGQPQVINDLSQGKYAVVVTVGPSYATQRMETVDILMKMAANPQLGPVVADMIAKNMDFAGSEELEKRLRAVGIRMGFIQPGEGDQAPQPQQPPPPNPVDIAKVNLTGAQTDKTLAETDRIKTETAARAAMLPHELHQGQANADKAGMEAVNAIHPELRPLQYPGPQEFAPPGPGGPMQ